MRREEDGRERLDGPLPRRDRDAALADINRLSAWFGGYALTIRAVRRLLGEASRDPHAPVIVDVGGGRGDLARRLVRAVRRRGGRVRVVLLAAHHQESSAPSAAKPGPSPIITPHSPGTGWAVRSVSSSTNRMVAEDMLP